MSDTSHPDAQPAESSPATESSDHLASLSPADLQSWEKSGVLPDGSAESSPATPDQAASTDASSSPASEPGKPAKGLKLKARSAEIEAENQALQEKLRLRALLREELARTDRPTDAPRDSSPAPDRAPEWKRYVDMPDAPQEDAFDNYRDFTAAMGTFIADKRYEERESRQRIQQQHSQHAEKVHQTIESAQARIQAYQQTDPDFATKVHPALLELRPVSSLGSDERIGPENVLAEEVLKSEVQPHLMLHFSTPEGQAEWGRMLRLAPSDLLRAFGRIEARFESQAPASTKTITSAPAPAMTLGRKPAAPANDVESAVANGDFAAYSARMNARDVAAHR